MNFEWSVDGCLDESRERVVCLYELQYGRKIQLWNDITLDSISVCIKEWIRHFLVFWFFDEETKWVEKIMNKISKTNSSSDDQFGDFSETLSKFMMYLRSVQPDLWAFRIIEIQLMSFKI